MPDLGDYEQRFHVEEEQLLARRKILLSQKQLLARVFTTDAARKRQELEKELAGVEKRIIEIRAILGQKFSNN